MFVDGYNIINCWGNLKAISDVSLDESRNELIETMAEYRIYTGVEIIVVFDAHMVKGSRQKNELIKDVEVVYTKENQTADQYIEKEVSKIGKIKKVTVATSDWVEQQVVLGRGATRISARELNIEIQQFKKNINKNSEKQSQVNDLIMGRLDGETLAKLLNLTETSK